MASDAHPPLPLDPLLEKVSATLRNLPGAIELVLYGSAADPAQRDAYSDLDLLVVSQRYEISRAEWPWILSQAGSITLAYALSESPGESAFSLALAGESLYHKIDIGLCDVHNEHSFLRGLDHKVLLWRHTPVAGPVSVSPGQPYLPEPGSAAHFLTGELLSSVRYVKARKRARHLTCWRFLSAKFNACLRCLAWEGDPGRLNAPLDTWQFNALDRALPEPERLGLLAGLELHTPAAMDRSLIALTRRIAECIAPGYPSAADPLSRLTREYIDFIARELSRPSA